MKLSEIILATTPSGPFSDQLLLRKSLEEKIVKKWQFIGPQFNIGQWVSDTEMQAKILSQSKITLNQHVKNLFIGLKNIIKIICFFFKVAITIGAIKNNKLLNFSEIRISYGVQGNTERTVTPDINSKNSKECFEIFFSGNGTLDYDVLKALTISDLSKSIYILSKSFKHIRLISSEEISYFFKEIWDFHCFQHCAIGVMAERVGIKKIIVVGEGLPRENCLNITQNLNVIRYNVTPSINLNRINTFYWLGEFKKMDKYKFQPKSNFLSNLPLYSKKTLSLEHVIKEVILLNQRVVLVPGFSDYSNRVCERLKIYLTEYSDLEIIIKSHPRRANNSIIQLDDRDIVIAEISTQFGLLRHFDSPDSKTFYFSNSSGPVFDPAPYTIIPLIIGNV
jgi:hypothetical protein